MDIIQSVIANMTIILAIIGALAFVVSVVTQVIKGVGCLLYTSPSPRD